MSAATIFRVCSSAAVLGWVLLVFAGRARYIAPIVCKFVIPGLLAAVYLGIILTHWAGHPGGFGSVSEVQRLFSDPWLVVAGWVHYLAFDLFIGAWQVRDAERSNIPHWWTIPSLILTFLFGPIGFLVYVTIRGLRVRSFAALRRAEGASNRGG